MNGFGPGGGYRGVNSGGGGGYGGVGGMGGHSGSYPCTNYGSAVLPLMPGSGGGDWRANYKTNGNGGGLVWIEATETVLIEGRVLANGGSPSGYQGGGSGGGIMISAPVIAGRYGMIMANGGKGGSESGGGGGGRVALRDWKTNQFDGTITVSGGALGSGPATAGSNGTIYVARDESYPFTLRVKGYPQRRGTCEPFDYGAYAMTSGAVVTNNAERFTETSGLLRYACYGWHLTNDSGAEVSSGSSTQAVFTMTENLTLSWLWTNQFYLSVTAGPNGSLVQDMSGWYTNGQQVSVTATADPGYVFIAWSGSGVPPGHNTDNPILLTMDQGRVLQANFASSTPQARSWNGTNFWLSPTNWTPAGLPGPSDPVTIQSGICSLADPTTVGSLTVAGGATLLFTNWTASLSCQTVIVESNGLITHAQCLTNSLQQSTNRIVITCTNLTVNAGGRINADGCGYRGGTNVQHGFGPGGGRCYTSGGGGGYGGCGSQGNPGHTYNYGGVEYGSPYAPREPGSGGAGPAGATGGAGGGCIVLTVLDKVTVDGRISANGQNGVSGNSGGGSGGSIYIVCRRVCGSGQVSANGGARSGEGGSGGGGRVAVLYDPAAQAGEMPLPSLTISASAAAPYYAGTYAEGGSIYLPDTRLFLDQIDLRFPGTNRFYGVNAWSPASLALTNGTAKFQETGFLLNVTNDVFLQGPKGGLALTGATVTVGGSMVVSNGSLVDMAISPSTGSSLSVSGLLTLDGGGLRYGFDRNNCRSLTLAGGVALTNGGQLILHSGPTNAAQPEYGGLLALSGMDLVVPTNCAVYVYSEPTNGGSVKIEARNVTVCGGGLLSADAGGFSAGVSNHPHGYGPGFGYRGVNSGGGGGYGGVGGMGGHAGSYPGTNYGSAVLPLMPGSGGGDWRGTSVNAGYGGGLIWIHASGIVTLDGTVSANGSSPSGYQGAGSGGGIYILCKKFAGSQSGILRANGGNGGSESGGGGGGRIAVECVSMQWAYTNNVSVSGGPAGGPTAQPGMPGTVEWIKRMPGGTVFVAR